MMTTTLTTYIILQHHLTVGGSRGDGTNFIFTLAEAVQWPGLSHVALLAITLMVFNRHPNMREPSTASECEREG